jgi:hypothetical protein
VIWALASGCFRWGERIEEQAQQQPCCGQDAGGVTRIRVFFSTMAAAILTRCSRRVSKS